jgi:hypothetical protein
VQAYPGLGTAGQLVEVRPGHARNFLVPRGLARLLNHFEGKEFKAKHAVEQQEQRDAGKQAQQGDVLNQVLERLTTHTVVRASPSLRQARFKQASNTSLWIVGGTLQPGTLPWTILPTHRSITTPSAPLRPTKHSETLRDS